MAASLKKFVTQSLSLMTKGAQAVGKIHAKGYDAIGDIAGWFDRAIEKQFPRDDQKDFADILRACSGVVMVIGTTVALVSTVVGVAAAGVAAGAAGAVAAACVLAPVAVFTMGAFNATEESPAFRSVVFRFIGDQSDIDALGRMPAPQPREEVKASTAKVKKDFTAAAKSDVIERSDNPDNIVIIVPKGIGRTIWMPKQKQ